MARARSASTVARFTVRHKAKGVRSGGKAARSVKRRASSSVKGLPAQRVKTARTKPRKNAKRRTTRPAAARLIAARKPARSTRGKARRASSLRHSAKPISTAATARSPAVSRPSASGNGSGRTVSAASSVGGYWLPSFLSVSPDISQQPWEHRRDYLILVAAIAASDSELHPDELKLLTTWMDRFNLTGEARAEVLRVANQGQIDLAQIARRLAGSPLTWSVMLDMMGMAMADGVLMDDEILLLRGLAAELKIDPIDFNILIEFVHSAHQAAQLSNPEPLYEHAIECAFDLLRRRKVKLFEHTRLCVNFPEYDRQLKERWERFETAGHG